MVKMENTTDTENKEKSEQAEQAEHGEEPCQAQEGQEDQETQDAEPAEKIRKLVFVRFLSMPTSYIFDAQGFELGTGDLVMVNTEAGQSVAKVLGCASEEDAQGLDSIKPVIRKLTEEDITRLKQIQEKDREYFQFCHQKILERNLPMKLTRVEQLFDGNKITFYFVAEGRVDFRELLKDLVEKFRTRIELRQVGTRQEAAMLGGIGSCGRELCCATYLTNFQRISVKMAKNQNMTLNPSKISGLCGKLKCCLAYEKEAYANLIDNLPKTGKKVFIEQGEAVVVSINVINQNFVAKLADRRFIKCKVSDILSQEEYIALSERRAKEPQKPKEEAVEVVFDAVNDEKSSEKPKGKRRRSSRNRSSRRKRSKAHE
ncbi:MAG TPA: regulatory iron-sulfur-containing complex subunit RicT [Deltaproteobacteria bacterium]|nr:regulatory iron-sulfur-containing complex subunit RicT [Deltaproteobacteria bacterium]